jgi:hypothetical protein
MGGACYYGEKYKKLWSENQKGRDLLQGLCVDGRVILERVFKKCGMRTWMDSSDLG